MEIEMLLSRGALAANPRLAIRECPTARPEQDWRRSRRELQVRCARHGGALRRADVSKGEGPPRRRAEKGARQEGERAGRGGGEKDEEIFSLSQGWKVDPRTLATEEALGSVGVQVPQRTKRQMVREKRAAQSEAFVEAAPDRQTHRMLRVMAGTQGGRRLLSPADAAVRPMMEVVRGAVFSMLQAIAGAPVTLPGGRWLDLYSGTGSVGIEALSRGCDTAHFVEMDPWVVSQVLGPNLDSCQFAPLTVVHTARVETFLQRAEQSGASFAGGQFDYISVTPPYEAVVFADLMAQLARSPLLSPDTCIIVEYPLRSKHEMMETCGPLVKIRDRRYGRTHLAVYGPEWAKDD